MITARNARDRALTLAALCGSKFTLAPALLQSARHSPGSQNWVIAALGEMILDKLGVLPPRYRPTFLIPRALAGAWVAHESLRSDDLDDPTTVALGAAAAVGVSVSLPIARVVLSRLGLPDPLLGLAEDAIVVRLGANAVGMPMTQVVESTREAIDQAREQFVSAFDGASDQLAPAAHAATE